MLGSLGSTGDAYDNAMAESFVDSFKTELIRDRVWKTRTQLELAAVEWVGWYNHDRAALSPRPCSSNGIRSPLRSTGRLISLSHDERGFQIEKSP